MQLKRIDPKALLYHYIERSPTQFALFDDEMDMPVAYGSRNLVDSTVRRLAGTVTVVYYKRDLMDKVSLKKRAVYVGRSKDTQKVKGINPNAIPASELVG